MTLQEMEKIEKKSKAKKVISRVAVGLSIAFNVFFTAVLAVGCATSGKNKQKQNNIQRSYVDSVQVVKNKVMPKLATYDDVNYTITLSVDELTNYTWFNFYTFLDNTSDVLDSSSNNLTYYGDTHMEYCTFNSHRLTLSDKYISTANFYFYLYDSNDYKFITNLSEIEHSLTIAFLSGHFDDVKQAIQSDIQSNEGGSITEDVFEAVSDTMGGFITTLNEGVQEMTNMFWDSTNNELTVMGSLSIIVVAVALAYWLFRLIVGLIRLRG